MRYIWLIPLLPGIGAAVNGLLGIRAFSRRTAGVVACTLMVAALGLSVTAEGVETTDQLARLRTLGCAQAKGRNSAGRVNVIRKYSAGTCFCI